MSRNELTYPDIPLEFLDLFYDYKAKWEKELRDYIYTKLKDIKTEMKGTDGTAIPIEILSLKSQINFMLDEIKRLKEVSNAG